MRVLVIRAKGRCRPTRVAMTLGASSRNLPLKRCSQEAAAWAGERHVTIGGAFAGQRVHRDFSRAEERDCRYLPPRIALHARSRSEMAGEARAQGAGYEDAPVELTSTRL